MLEDITECGACHNTLSFYDLDNGCCSDCNYTFNPHQRQWAQQSPGIYSQKITLIDGTETTVLRMAEQLLDGRIIERFGWFAVTTFGIECLNHEYSIENTQLDSQNWIEHMGQKSWVDIKDFSDAIKSAKERYKNPGT